jgi:hypothetical protein
MGTEGTMPIPGAIFTFALANGLHGACRVIRGPSDLEAINFAGHMLVSATPWVGKTVEELRAVLKAPDTKKTLKTAMGVALYWMKDAPPPEFTAAGAIALPKGDLTKASRTTGPWSMFPNVVYGHWRKQNEPNAVAADRAASEEEGRRRQAAALEHLEKHDGIDLAGLVPLPKPKTEREPVEVLRGFIAAMNRWEAESERIFKQPDGALVTRFNRPAQELIFDEFCTPKDRKYGRLGQDGQWQQGDALSVRVERCGPRGFTSFRPFLAVSKGTDPPWSFRSTSARPSDKCA